MENPKNPMERWEPPGLWVCVDIDFFMAEAQPKKHFGHLNFLSKPPHHKIVSLSFKCSSSTVLCSTRLLWDILCWPNSIVTNQLQVGHVALCDAPSQWKLGSPIDPSMFEICLISETMCSIWGSRWLWLSETTLNDKIQRKYIDKCRTMITDHYYCIIWP